MKIRFAFVLGMVGFIATVGSCTNRSLDALNPCTINGVVQNVPVNPQRALDVLFVIDDSPSMLEEQLKLAEQVPRLVDLLLNGGVDSSDGSTPVGEFPAVESMHVAVVTPDLGHSTEPMHPYTAGVDFEPTAACKTNGGKGQDGFMQIDGYIDEGSGLMMCTAQTPPVDTLYLNRSDGTDAEFVRDVTCITGQTDGNSATAGCGFEQQLESILAQGQNSANAGFSREDALLAVILITDEDDCSTTDPRVFDVEPRPGNPYQGPFLDPPTNSVVKFNLRCWEHSEALQEVKRYVEGITSLKADPSQVVFAAITGIPEDPALDRGQFSSDEARYDAILAHPGMEEVPNPADADQQSQQLTPACTATDGSGFAVPGRRVVETAKGLAAGATGVGTVVESICASDYAPALNAIVERIAAALRQLCLPRPLTRNSLDLVGCEVREVQPEGRTCAEAGNGREPDPVATEDGRDVCRITQLPARTEVPTGFGWFYDDFTQETIEACQFYPEQQRVTFTEGSEPQSGARIRFECLQAATPPDADVGFPCAGVSDCVTPECAAEGDAAACMGALLEERYDRSTLSLACDPDTNTCQLSCTNNAECPAGFACYDGSEDGNSYCVNPTCSLN